MRYLIEEVRVVTPYVLFSLPGSLFDSLPVPLDLPQWYRIVLQLLHFLCKNADRYLNCNKIWLKVN
ncbi:hypothetical protein K8B34_20870, partial [Alteromonas stellipolaris]